MCEFFGEKRERKVNRLQGLEEGRKISERGKSQRGRMDADER